MIGYAKNNDTMFFKVINKTLLKMYKIILEKNSTLINKKDDSEPVYGGNDNYIKTKIKSYRHKEIQIFKFLRKYMIQMFVIGNARFCYQSK